MAELDGRAMAKDGESGVVERITRPIEKAMARAEEYRRAGQFGAAADVCREALAAQPDEPNVIHMLGVIAHASGKLDEAIAHVRRAVALAPQAPLFHANLGEMLRLVGHAEEAIAEGRRAIALRPDYPEALSNLGVALFEQKQYQEAAQHHRRAVELRPDFALGHSNLGNALHALKRLDEAAAAYRRAIALAPGMADAWSNLGTTLHHCGQFQEGMAALRRAIALAPDHANAHSGLGILLLMRGEFGEGWEEYEWRLRSPDTKGPPFPTRPWRGESLAGRRLYVQAEQGFGDTIQFARYLPRLQKRAGSIAFRVPQTLVSLMRESLPGVELYGDRAPTAPADCECALLSLGYLLKTRMETIPANVPYLRPPQEIEAAWRERLGAMPNLKVGVAWAGRPEHSNDFRRSLALSALEPIFSTEGVSFASLQVGPPTAELATRRGRKVADLSPHLKDYAETAGAIAALDLVIAVDTSVAHLAGALGKPTWVLLPEVNDWRWLLDREDNPWYPTMRLFRPRQGERWPEVIARAAAELKAAARGDATRLAPFKAAGERRAESAAEIIAAEDARASSPAASRAQEGARMPAARAVALAEENRRQGRLAEADALARRVLEAEPGNAEAAHLLGIIAHQSGKLAEAIDHLRRATSIQPDSALYHANLGEMYRLAGRVDEAVGANRRAIELKPDNPAALSNLAAAMFDQSKFEEALAYQDQAIAAQERFPQAHNGRANALLRLKRYSEAERSYRRALELQPALAGAWNNLGTCLRELKRPREAEAAYRKALELGPDNPDTLDNLALVLKDLDLLRDAAELLRRALSIESRNPHIHVHLGSVELDLEEIDKADAALKRALALDPNNADAINLLGRVAFERREPHAALEHYRRALSLKPDLADAYNNMGNALKEVGQLKEAEAAYIEAIRLDPRNVGIYVNLSDSRHFTPGDPYLVAMEALQEQRQELSDTERTQLDFALGKAYADLKDHGRAFARLKEGNAGKRATISYDEKSVLGLFDRIEEAFTPELIATKSGAGDASPRPIFVLGMPRSGTTLVEQIIASHPMAHGAGELRVFGDITRTVRGPDHNPIPYPDFVSSLSPPALRQIGARYISELHRLAPDGERVTDKMPSNYYFAGLIHLALPNAKIVHTIRDPIDTCLSCYSRLFASVQDHTYDLGELGRYYRRYERLMAHWRRVLPPGRILDVRYEDVVADLEGQARRIISSCGLPWDDRCLSFHETERPVRTASATQVRRPIYQSAVGRWRAYGAHLAPLLEALGLTDQYQGK
jgi:tetratricopeptide (TPR) repeat protein